MGPDEDDFEEHEPLPDPTMRAWRHPSELAAVAAMAARDEPGPARRRRLAFGSLLLGSALGAVAVLAVIASTGLVGGEPTTSRLALRDPGSTPAVPGQGEPDIPSSEPGYGTSTSTSTSTPTSSTTVATTGPPAAAPGPLPTLHGVDGELAAAGLPAVPSGAVVGVAVHRSELSRPRCTGLVVDGLVVTSASAIGEASQVTLVVAGAAYPATVLGRDRYTDVAVLDPGVDAPLHELPIAAEGTDAVAVVATDGRPEPITVLGRITGWDQVVAASDGHDLIGLVTTSARLPESGAGSLLLDPSGALVGMVVDTPGHLASAVPVATLRSVTRSLRDLGHPVPVWLGVSVIEVAEEVIVKRVDPAGPSAAAGLRANDVVVSLDGVPISDQASFFATVRSRSAGDPMTVIVERGGDAVAVDVVLASPPAPGPPAADEPAAD